MERVGILLVSYGARGVAMADAFLRSPYEVELYVASKQDNPSYVREAEEIAVIPDLNVETICKFAGKNKGEIDFGIVGPEGPIIAGVRDEIEEEFDIPIIGPTKRYALEASKVRQRLLLQDVAPEANPMFKVFDPRSYRHRGEERLFKDVKGWINELGGVGRAVIKPDKPGFGKGVGVGGEHFFDLEQALTHFLSLYGEGREQVIIEEKIECEESSFQAWCDGKRLAVVPETRDYKRAFDGDKGPNTGGMGTYKAAGDILPFMIEDDKEEEIKIITKVFEKLRREEDCISPLGKSAILGIPFYGAIAHTGRGVKLFEINSRPGDPEIQCVLPVLVDDFVEVCFDMLDGKLSSLNHMRQATVTTYVVPDVYPKKDRKIREVDLSGAYGLRKRYEDKIRIYPASMELRDGETYAGTSRTVCVVGIGDDLQRAREISMEGVEAIKGSSLRYRTDIASEEHIKRSREHMKRLRSFEGC